MSQNKQKLAVASSSTLPDTSVAHSTPPSRKVFSSLRRSASQFFSNFGSKSKRKAAEELHSPDRAAVDPSQQSTIRTPNKKRARIDAPESLGKEESRRLVALLDQPSQPKFDAEMMRKLEAEKTALIVRPRVLDPAEESRDDAEIEDVLGCPGDAQSKMLSPEPVADGGVDSQPGSHGDDELNGSARPQSTLAALSVMPEEQQDPPDVAGYAKEKQTDVATGSWHKPQSNGNSSDDTLMHPIDSDEARHNGTDGLSNSLLHQPNGSASQISSPPALGPAIVKSDIAGHDLDLSQHPNGSLKPSDSETEVPNSPLPEAVPPEHNSTRSLSPPICEAAPLALDLTVSAELLRNPSLGLVSGDALTEDVAPVEVDMLAAERTNDVDPRSRSISPGEASDPGNLIGENSEGPAMAVTTKEIGEEEDVVVDDELSRSRSSQSQPSSSSESSDFERMGEAVEPAVQKEVAVVDFTQLSDSEDEDEILVTATVKPPQDFVRQRSLGLLRGPLTEAATSTTRRSAPDASRNQNPTFNSSPAGLIRQLGRVSLNQAGSRLSTPSIAPSNDASADSVGGSVRAKRPHIREREHRQRIQQARLSAQSSEARSRPTYSPYRTPVHLSPSTNHTTGLFQAQSVDDPHGLAQYKQYLARTLGPTATNASSRTSTQARSGPLAGSRARETARQRNFELLLQKSRFTQSKIRVPPSKELLRLRREEKERERRRRGILGRPPLPSALDADQDGAVQQALSDPSWKSSITGASAKNRDIMMLRPGQWMNDETITFYMTMINQRSAQAEEARRHPSHDKRWNAFYRVHAFNSHFWARLDTMGFQGVSRWTRKVDLFSKDLILVPCNLGNSHWTCAAINLRRGRIEYYDSMGGENHQVVRKLQDYMRREMADKGKTVEGTGCDPEELREYFGGSSSPQQRNGYDCGVFVCATLEQLSRRDPHYPFDADPEPESDEDGWEDEDEDDVRSPVFGAGSSKHSADHSNRSRGGGYYWNFGQANMPYMRRRIIFEILQKKLLD